MDKPFTCVVLMVQVCVYVFYCLKNSFADYATLVTGSTSEEEFLVPVISVVLVITGLASIQVIIIACVFPTVVIIITFHAVVLWIPTVLVGVIRAFIRVVGVIMIIERIIKVIWVVIVLILIHVEGGLRGLADGGVAVDCLLVTFSISRHFYFTFRSRSRS